MSQVSNLISRYSLASAADGQKTGDSTGVGFFIPLPADLAKQFPSLDPKDKSDPHVTFLYVGKVPKDKEELLVNTAQDVLWDIRGPVRAHLDGLDHFVHPASEERVAVTRVRFSHDLAGLRWKLRDALQGAGFQVDDSFPLIYSPHVTLAYQEGLNTDYAGTVPTGDFVFDTIEIWGLSRVHQVGFAGPGRVAALHIDAMKNSVSVALMKFLSDVARRLGVGDHTYVVGGAVRNFVLKQPVKDVDVVIDPVALKRPDASAWFAKQVAAAIPVPTSLVTNNYGVAILTVKNDWIMEGENLAGETIEIANARKESYGGEEGKGYKPHMVEPATIQEDVLRREFNFNTLMWRLNDLANGPDKAEIIDLTGCGLKDIQEGMLRCPRNPDIVFSDDPSRLIRVIKFTMKYGFKVPPDVEASIRRNAPKLRNIPSGHLSNMLIETFFEPGVGKKALLEMDKLGLLDVTREIARSDPKFAAALANWADSRASVEFVFDLMDLGMPSGKRLNFLEPAQKKRVREITVQTSAAGADTFVQALGQPGKVIDMPKLIAEFGLKGADIRKLMQEARITLLDDPALIVRPSQWEGAIRGRMGKPKTANLQGVVEVPKNIHPVEVQPPKAKRKKFPFEGYIDFQGLEIDVENKAGSTRKGENPDGTTWETKMFYSYGEIRKTEGADGEQLDCYVGPNHDSSLVVVVHQHDPETGKFDEDKVMLGFDSEEEAIGAYKKQYDKPGFYQKDDYLAMPIGQFWRWVHEDGNKGKKVKDAGLVQGLNLSLNKGDPVFYGKFKNKPGILRDFKIDSKSGDPIVVIEPDPKGQKDDKEMKLLKIRERTAPSGDEKAALEGHTPRDVQLQDRDTIHLANRYLRAAMKHPVEVYLQDFENALRDFDYTRDRLDQGLIAEYGSDHIAWRNTYLKRPWTDLAAAGNSLARSILDTRSVPAAQHKKLEVAIRAFSGFKRSPRNIDKWWDTGGKEFSAFLIAAAKWPEKTMGGEEKFPVGPFIVHNTVGATGPELDRIRDVLTKAVSAIERLRIPADFKKVLYGDVYLVARLKSSRTLAWYYPQDDNVYMRTTAKGNWDEAASFIHELGHRYLGKFASRDMKTQWYSRHFLLSNGGGDRPAVPKPGEPLNVPIKGMKGFVPVVKGFTGTHLTFDMPDGREAQVSYAALVNLLKVTAVAKSFPTAYSMKDYEEHFCEAVGLRALGQLKGEHEEAFDRIWSGGKAKIETALQVAKIAARYQDKKTVKKQDGGTMTVYEYSDRQIADRNRAKAEQVEKLRKSIGKLREQVQKDLTSKDEHTKAVALAVGLMDATYERIGNVQSAKEGHFGVTGWKVRFVTFSGGKATIKYVGKSGVKHEKAIDTPASVKALKDAVKGKKPDDEVVDCSAEDVNEYLKPFDVSAKDIRGYHANTEMQTRLKAVRGKGGKLPTDKKEREKKLKDEFKTALEETAEAVGHEAATLKSQYLVPGLEDEFLKDGTVTEKLTKKGFCWTAPRTLFAGLSDDLAHRVERLIQDYDKALSEGRLWPELIAIGESFAKWFTSKFSVEAPATPKGGKALKELARKFLWSARSSVGQQHSVKMLRADWELLRSQVDSFVALFSAEEGSAGVREIQTPLALYKNIAGLSTTTFEKYVKALDITFGTLRGWRRKALAGSFTVALAGADKFRGTAAGRYNAPSDTLFVRATPKVMQRSGGSYGSPEYILIHELGHRYEHFNSVADPPYTTPYSRSEGGFGQSEAFAELFALGHFGIRSYRTYDFGDTVDRFEAGHGTAGKKGSFLNLAIHQDPFRWCPVCGAFYSMQTRCTPSTFECPNGHKWVWCDVHARAVVIPDESSCGGPRQGCLCGMGRPVDNPVSRDTQSVGVKSGIEKLWDFVGEQNDRPDRLQRLYERHFPAEDRSAEHYKEWIASLNKVATKTPLEREDDEAERLLRPEPKKKPPRNDLRRERMDADPDKDTENTGADKDTDLSLNFKRVASDWFREVLAGSPRIRKRKGKPPAAPKLKGVQPIPKATDPQKPASPAGEPAKKEEEHKPGDVWQSDKGWVGKNPEGVPHTFKEKEPAQAYAKGAPVEEAKGEGKGEEGGKAEVEKMVEGLNEVLSFEKLVSEGGVDEFKKRLKSLNPKLEELGIDPLGSYSLLFGMVEAYQGASTDEHRAILEKEINKSVSQYRQGLNTVVKEINKSEKEEALEKEKTEEAPKDDAGKPEPKEPAAPEEPKEEKKAPDLTPGLADLADTMLKGKVKDIATKQKSLMDSLPEDQATQLAPLFDAYDKANTAFNKAVLHVQSLPKKDQAEGLAAVDAAEAALTKTIEGIKNFKPKAKEPEKKAPDQGEKPKEAPESVDPDEELARQMREEYAQRAEEEKSKKPLDEVPDGDAPEPEAPEPAKEKKPKEKKEKEAPPPSGDDEEDDESTANAPGVDAKNPDPRTPGGRMQIRFRDLDKRIRSERDYGETSKAMKGGLESKFLKLTPEGQERAASAFESQMRSWKGKAGQGITHEMVVMATGASVAANRTGQTAEGMGESAANLMFAMDHVANPAIAMNVNDTDEGNLKKFGTDAYDHYGGLNESLRHEAYRQLSTQLSEAEEGSPRHRQLRKVLEGLHMASIAEGDDPKTRKVGDSRLQPEPSDSFKGLIGSLSKGGISIASMMDEDFYSPNGRKNLRDHMKSLNDDDLTDLFSGPKSDFSHFMKSAMKGLKEPWQRDALRQLMGELVLEDMTTIHAVITSGGGSKSQGKDTTRPHGPDEETTDMAAKLAKFHGDIRDGKDSPFGKAARTLIQCLKDHDGNPKGAGKCKKVADKAKLQAIQDAMRLLDGYGIDIKTTTDPTIRKWQQAVKTGDVSELDKTYQEEGKEPPKFWEKPQIADEDHKPGDVWQSDKGWVGKNPEGVSHAFDEKEDADAYARGEESGREKTGARLGDPEFFRWNLYNDRIKDKGRIAPGCPSRLTMRRLSMAQMTKKGALEVTGALDRMATLFQQEHLTLGVTEKLAMDFAKRCDMLADFIEKSAGIDPRNKKALTGDDVVKEPGFNPEEIGAEVAGPLEKEPDEPYMNGEFTSQENRELRERVEDGDLGMDPNPEPQPPTAGRQASYETLGRDVLAGNLGHFGKELQAAAIQHASSDSKLATSLNKLAMATLAMQVGVASGKTAAASAYKVAKAVREVIPHVASTISAENQTKVAQLIDMATKLAALPPEFLENIEKKKEEGKKNDEKDEKKDEKEGGKKASHGFNLSA